MKYSSRNDEVLFLVAVAAVVLPRILAVSFEGQREKGREGRRERREKGREGRGGERREVKTKIIKISNGGKQS